MAFIPTSKHVRSCDYATGRRYGAVAPAPSDGPAATDALVAQESAIDAQGPNLACGRHVRLGLRRSGALGPAGRFVLRREHPRFWTVSFLFSREHGNFLVSRS